MRPGDVLELLRDGRPWTRAQLAEATGLSRSTVRARIEVLQQLGLVTPYGDGVSTGGRRPALLALNPAGWVVAGVDVGATHVHAVLGDLAGQVLQEARVDMEVAEGPEAVLGWVTDAVTSMLERQRRGLAELAAVGLGLPGPVEHSTGRPNNPPIMPGWDRYDVPGALQRTLPVPVLVDNDVNIMALGEQQVHLPHVSDLVFIKVATGIGAGIISGGALQRGDRGTAGDLGHVRVSRGTGVMCRCGNEGCLEAVAAGPALADRLREAGVPARTSQDVVDLVRGGDRTAVQVVREGGRDIGEVVASLVNIVNPAVVVIGGRLAEAGEHLLAGIREVVYRRSLPLATQHLRVMPSGAGAEVGVRGALAMATGHALSPSAIEQASQRLGGGVAAGA
ncbi:ROK family transcriptional regulator [Ornithinicoccus halotolerans]|uniref:ROK family transcriptional regulator n=1 Tax=Ornithinicoccus halotolerans TaxID=1748220 RepID=UPI001E3ABABD|nr:ROK family transcriptional regulator [Ornithinicoccus halotolerans]